MPTHAQVATPTPSLSDGSARSSPFHEDGSAQPLTFTVTPAAAPAGLPAPSALPSAPIAATPRDAVEAQAAEAAGTADVSMEAGVAAEHG
jgi:hypothetical protein